MNSFKTFLLAAMCTCVVGCNQPGESSGGGESASGASERAMGTEAGMADERGGMSGAPAEGGSTQVDHSKDEKEFRLKASIAGLEELAADYRERGLDPSEVEAQIAEKKAELESL